MLNLGEINIGDKKIKVLQVILFILFLVGLLVVLYLIKKPQIFKSKASNEIYDAFTFTDNQGKIYCDRNICTTNALDINVKIDIDQLEKIANQE